MASVFETIARLDSQQAYLLGVDETVTEITPQNGTDFSLEELYRLLGCEMVEVVNLNDGRLLLIDEEAKIFDPPRPGNELATCLAWNSIRDDDWISGPAIVCRDNQLT